MILLWVGPVSLANLDRAKWRGAPPRKIIVINKGAGGKISSSAFARLAQELGDPLRAILKGDAGGAEPVTIGTFSAGFALVEPILRSKLGRERVAAVGAFDSYYCGSVRPPKPGFLWFAREAIARRKRMVLTASRVPSGKYPSVQGCSVGLLEQLAVHPIAVRSFPPAICDEARGAGDFAWYLYRNRSTARASHAQHATILAPAFLPELAAGASVVEPSDGFGWVELAAAAFVAHEVLS